MSDDLTGSYMNSRGQASTPFDDLMAAQPVEKEESVMDTDLTGVAADIGRGIIEAPRQIIGGVMDVTKEMAQMMENYIPLGTIGGDEVTEESFITTDDPESTTGGLIRGVSQFVAGFLPAVKGMKALGVTSKIGQAMGAGAVVDAVAFDPHEDRLSNLVEQFPALSNPVTRYLEADPDDSDAEGRFKNAIEGLGLGAVFDTFTTGVKLLRANRIEKAVKREVMTNKQTATKLAESAKPAESFISSVDELSGLSDDASMLVDELIDNGAKVTKEGNVKVYHRTTKEAADKIKSTGRMTSKEKDVFFSTSQNGQAAGFGDEIVELSVPANKLHLDDVFGDEAHVRMEGNDVDVDSFMAKPDVEPKFTPFEETAAKSSPGFKTGAGKAADDAASNINLNNIDSTDQVDDLINKVAEIDAPKINEARREVITLQETEKLADDLGMSVEDLLDRRKGQAFNAEQAVAARKIMVSSGENLFNLAQKASTGSDEEVAIFARAMSQHRAIQAQVSGLTAEAGRALSSFRIQAKSAEGQTRAINEALLAGGGVENMKDIAAQVAAFDNVGQLNVMLKQGATKGEMVFEAWINGLLSSPTTHAVNALSNAIVAGWSVGERKVASMISKGFGDNAIGDGEVVGQLFGIVQGGKDGMKLAWKALKTGDASDPLQKIEQQQFKRITAENLDLTGTAGRFADFVGEVVRIPGRALTAGDELFKTMGYRMELNAQAFRTAKNEGLEGEALSKRIVDIINNPPDNINLEAIDASRYQTFTKELGERGKSVQGVLLRNPEARVIVPFLRTPTNIMKWVGERTPLAPMSTAVKAEIAAGGARRDMALAKIATGSMVMALAADYSMSGNITGGGPKNPSMRNMLRETGWQPYSIKVGDNYYAYQRLDPVGAFIGLSADVTEIMGQTNEADTLDLVMSAVTATAQNVTSKTYLSGVAEFFDMMSGISADPESANKQAQRWIERMAGSVIPSGVAQLERTLSPELSATQGIIEKIQSRIPGWSDSLPPRRNIFGEPIVLSGGLGPDIMSPIYTSSNKHDPISDEIVAQGTLLRMPLKNISGVELSTEQYDDYILFYSGKDNRAMNFIPLKDRLDQEMHSNLYMGGSDGPEGLKSEVITRVFAAYRNSAKAEMLNKYPEIKNEIDRLKIEKAMKLKGQ